MALIGVIHGIAEVIERSIIVLIDYKFFNICGKKKNGKRYHVENMHKMFISKRSFVRWGQNVKTKNKFSREK